MCEGEGEEEGQTKGDDEEALQSNATAPLQLWLRVPPRFKTVLLLGCLHLVN